MDRRYGRPVERNREGTPIMTPEQTALIKTSFKQLPTEAAAELFYTRLFELAPQLRGMFKSDMKAQEVKLMTMLAAVVEGLDRIESLLPTVRDLGARHAGYGATPEHFDIVGEALLWTLEKGLGETFTEEVKEAWTETYCLLSSVMIQAAGRKAA